MAQALPQLAPRHWVYLDAARTHEVHAQVAPTGAKGLLVTTEFPVGSRDPAESVTTRTTVEGEAALQRLLGELEERLAFMGKYYRTHAEDLWWTPLPAPSRAIDLRAHESPIPGVEGGKMRFHLFHGKTEDRDRLLISMPRPGMSGRHVLAEMTFRFPDIEAGSLEVVHARLAGPVLASAVVKEHIEAPRRGFRKLFDARDYEEAYGERWVDRAGAMFSRAAARLVAGPAPTRTPAPRPPGDLERIQQALASSRVEALRARHVDPVTESRLVEGGEHAIRRQVARMRSRATHTEAYELSVLEAVLLLQYAIPARMWDLAQEEGAKVVRYVYGFG